MYVIYKITNTVNGKSYIGQHKTNSILKDDGYKGSGVILHRAYKKYGNENFSKAIITFAMNNNEADVLEKYYIAKEKKNNSNGCYNISDGGQGENFCGPTANEHRRKISVALTGRHFSEETKKKQSAARLGYKMPEETKKKISITMKNKGGNSTSWKKGQLHTEEWKEQMKGRKWYTNGTINVRQKSCPEGFFPGRTNKRGDR